MHGTYMISKIIKISQHSQEIWGTKSFQRQRLKYDSNLEL